jgi:integrase
MNKLYNEEIKEQFLSQYDNEMTKKTIRNVFANTALIEKILDKDLYEMSLEELGKAIENTNPITKNVSRSNGRFISQYISWTIEPPHRYRKNTINPLKGVPHEWFDGFINKHLKIHYSYSEFLELLEDVQNYQDKSLLFLLFFGISGERFSQILELKVNDINFEDKTVYVKERDYHVPVSEECIQILDKAINEKTYYSYVPKSKEFKEKELLDSPYFLKNVKSPRTSEGSQISMAVVYNRFAAIKDYLGLSYLTPKSLEQSGMIKLSIDLYNQYGKLGYDELAIVGERYAYSKLNNNGYEYYNTYLMREFINENSIKDLYDLDIEMTKR